ncbi:retropepsin-like aspartic protease family protein [Sedimenticola thiotaurini]|nr:TIGR02281 family clan AA aspartic protease [Sedimenticola thiotaurini]
MMILSWVLLLVLMSFLFSNILERQNNPNRDPVSLQDNQGNSQVVLKRNRAGHYVASGRINGHPVLFLLDTGATDVAISDELAERLELPRGRQILSQTANGTVVSWRTRLAEVGLGDITLRDVSASILPGMEGNDVLLGMSFLKRLEWTQRGNQLTLKKL